MKIRYSANTYHRTAGDSSLLWHRRNTACMILKSAEIFLNEIGWEPVDTDVIAKRIADKFEVDFREVNKDFHELCAPLLANGLLEAEGFWEVEGVSPKDAKTAKAEDESPAEQHDNSWTPLGSFFEENHLPCELHIDLTNGCTERCIHCYIPDYTPHFLPLELAKKILTEFREAEGLTVHFSGGECMMHPDFAEILRFAKSLHLNMLILSNLTLCDAEKIALLKEIDPQFVNVSLYSMDAGIHDGITTLPGSWQRTMNAILALQAAGVHIRLAAPMMKNNQFCFDALKKFADEHHVHLIPDSDIFGQTNHDCSNQCCALSPQEFEAALRRYPKLFPLDSADAEHCRPEHKVCDIGRSRIDINSEGNYYPCDGCHGIILGNAREMSFSEVWYGEKLNALRALRNQDFGECATCEHRPWCKVCPTRNFNETGDIFRHTKERCIAAAIRHKLYKE